LKIVACQRVSYASGFFVDATEDSVSVIRKLITIHKLPVIFGLAVSLNFLAVCPIAQENKTILIGAESTAAEITKCGDNVFRIFPSDELQGKCASYEQWFL